MVIMGMDCLQGWFHLLKRKYRAIAWNSYKSHSYCKEALVTDTSNDYRLQELNKLDIQAAPSYLRRSGACQAQGNPAGRVSGGGG